jgi:ABC-type nitrate/sulfonate/bicarbonate transport system ATPase subunit
LLKQNSLAIQENNVSYEFKTSGGVGTAALPDALIEVGRGELISLIGFSGCG